MLQMDGGCSSSFSSASAGVDRLLAPSLGLAVVKHGVEPKIGLFQDEVDKGLLDYVTGLVSSLGFPPFLIYSLTTHTG